MYAATQTLSSTSTATAGRFKDPHASDGEIPCPIHSTELNTYLSSEPWRLGCAPANKIDSRKELLVRWRYHIHISKKSDCGEFYEVAVRSSCISWFSFHELELNYDYISSKPREKAISAHGIKEATRRACARFLQNAATAIRSGGILELEQCYRAVALRLDLGTPLERAILEHDILESPTAVRRQFAQRLVFLGLNLLGNYDSPPALALLTRDQDNLLQSVKNGYRDLSKIASEQATSVKMVERLELQTISLLRGVLELCGGRVECRQHAHDQEYTASENAAIYGSLIGITGTNRFGNFDLKQMHNALIKSKVFAEDREFSASIAVEWSMIMMNYLPIGFPEGYLGLPSQMLSKFCVGDVNRVRIYFEQIYHQSPSLKRPENNILLLLCWTSMTGGKPLEALTEWASMGKSLELYQRLVRDFQDSQTSKQLGLTVIAFLCHERLLPYSSKDTTQPIQGFYLADLDALLKGQSLSNKRTIFERLAFSFLRVATSLGDNYIDIIQLFVTTLNKEAPLLERFDGLPDQYFAARMRFTGEQRSNSTPLNHKSACEEVGVLELMEAVPGHQAGWLVVQTEDISIVAQEE